MATATSVDREVGRETPPTVRPAWTMPLAIAVIALVLRLWAPGPVTQTQDEFNWLLRSDTFRTALLDGDFAAATVTGGGTMPGVTTMWAGTFGHATVSLAHTVGLVDKAPTAFDGTVLRVSRGFVALWCSIALGLFVALACLLVGRRAATIAGVLLATEPFLVGHSDVLHTDAMVTMFSALSVVALMVALRAGRPDQPDASAENATHPGPAPFSISRRGQTLLVLVSGASAGLATLTKLNAVPLVLGALAVVLVNEVLAVRRRTRGRAGWWTTAWRLVTRAALTWSIAAIAVVFVLWPALWVAPGEQITLIRHSLDQLSKGSGQTFYRGHLTDDPGVTYYPVAMLFRMTPWFMVGATISALVIVGRWIRGLRHRGSVNAINNVGATLLLTTVPYVVIITFTSQKYDRYGLPLFPFLALACGIVLADAVGWLALRVRSDRWVLPAGALATAALTLSTLVQAPYAISYADPLVGGQKQARKDILLGWGEGLEPVGKEIGRREAGHCDDVKIFGPYFYVVAFTCGRLVSYGSIAGDVRAVDYFVRYVSSGQRASAIDARMYRDARRYGTLVKTVSIGGVHYAELWKIRHPVRR